MSGFNGDERLMLGKLLEGQENIHRELKRMGDKLESNEKVIQGFVIEKAEINAQARMGWKLVILLSTLSGAVSSKIMEFIHR